MTKSDASTIKPAQVNISKSSSFSMVWFIPILALVLGAWLVYKNERDKGPLITIHFDSATGIEQGKTKIKYKDVALGIVESIDINDDFSGVIVSARMNNEISSFLNENTKFWIVKPRVGLGGVSGLSTLISGAYIGIDSSEDGKPANSFIGLKNPPPRENTVAGLSISLQADNPGSLNIGSPVYFKQFRVGQIDSIELSQDFSNVDIKAFIEAPYDQLINQDSNFWSVSGISADVSANGISVELESIESLISGGIAFNSPVVLDKVAFDAADVVFRLYDNKQSVGIVTYANKKHYILNFEQSIRGLNVGAPVDYRGIEIGEVVRIDIEYDEKNDKVNIPVLVEIEPGRAGLESGDSISTVEKDLQRFQEIINQGFRAKLQTGNFLTGQLFISVDFYPDAGTTKARFFNGYPEIPTISNDLGEITSNISSILEKVNKLEIDKLVDNMNLAVVDLRTLLGNTDSKIIPVLNSVEQTLAESRKLMQGLDEDSITRYELNTLIREMQEAARSVRTLVETIEENPNSVIFGKLRKSER